MKLKEITVGFVIKTDTSCEDWASVLIGDNPEKKLRRFIRLAIKEFIESSSNEAAGTWDPKERAKLLKKVCDRFSKGDYDGEQIDGYVTEDERECVSFNIWNKYPATLVDCKLEEATHALILGDIGELWAEGTRWLTPDLYLYNKKKTPLRKILLKQVSIGKAYLDEFLEYEDLESGDSSTAGPLETRDGDIIDVVSVFKIGKILGRD